MDSVNNRLSILPGQLKSAVLIFGGFGDTAELLKRQDIIGSEILLYKACRIGQVTGGDSPVKLPEARLQIVNIGLVQAGDSSVVVIVEEQIGKCVPLGIKDDRVLWGVGLEPTRGLGETFNGGVLPDALYRPLRRNDCRK